MLTPHRENVRRRRRRGRGRREEGKGEGGCLYEGFLQQTEQQVTPVLLISTDEFIAEKHTKVISAVKTWTASFKLHSNMSQLDLLRVKNAMSSQLPCTFTADC